MSKMAIYTLVFKGRHQIKEKLGLVIKNVTVETPEVWEPHVTNYESGLYLFILSKYYIQSICTNCYKNINLYLFIRYFF